MVLTTNEECSITFLCNYFKKKWSDFCRWDLIEEFETQNGHTLIANIGGQLGLWLGFSILSLVVSVLDAILAKSNKKNAKNVKFESTNEK